MSSQTHLWFGEFLFRCAVDVVAAGGQQRSVETIEEPVIEGLLQSWPSTKSPGHVVRLIQCDCKFNRYVEVF